MSDHERDRAAANARRDAYREGAERRDERNPERPAHDDPRPHEHHERHGDPDGQTGRTPEHGSREFILLLKGQQEILDEVRALRRALALHPHAPGDPHMSVRAKVRCNSKSPASGPGTATSLSFGAVFSDDPASENKAFSDATPSLSLSMSIADGKPAADQFEQGKEYYLDFTPAE